MATSDISLTVGMRNNLFQLQATSHLIDRTQERLSTGRKVNSALDNPTNFFASQAALKRAGDLNSRKDFVKEALQNIDAATNGVTAISSLLEAAAGIANAAMSTSDLTSRDALSKQFDQLLNQIDTIASDSSYRGTNLLKSQSLTVNFAETSGVSTLDIAGVDATSAGLGVDLVNKTDTITDVSNNIAAGNGYSLAINSDGTVSAWGDLSNPGAVVPVGLTDVVSVKSGPDFSVALKGDGTVVAWGSDASGQVSGAAGLTGITAISAGTDFVLALKSDGTVASWGNNSSNVVSGAASLSGVTAISAGTSVSNGVALKNDGSIVSWGFDGFGMVTGTTSFLDGSPIDPPTGTGYTAIANGGFQAVAIKADSSVFVWGTDDAYGQKSDMPAGLTGVTAVAAGWDFTLALKSDGTVVGWGSGITSNNTNLAIPAGLTGVVAISAGTNYAIALKDDGTVVGWGAGAASGTTATQSGVSVSGAWAMNADIQKSQDQVTSAINTMRSDAKNLAINNSILSTRIDFISSLSGILQTGADNLTLADMNEEGANMLMLQTRQNLGTSSLSMAAQSAQSVMRLF